MSAAAGQAASAGVQALAGLAQGIFAAKVEEKKRKTDALNQGLQAKLAAQTQSANTLATGTNNAFAQMMAQYGGLIR